MNDRYDRNIEYIRVSVTDKCNLKCVYCMPEDIEYTKNDKLLTDVEIIKLCKIFAQKGIKKVKITGGEPLVRKDINKLIKSIKNINGIDEVTITTNGILLEKFINDLEVDCINVSLDSIDEKEFLNITKYNLLSKVLKGIDSALDIGKRVKINCVPIGVNGKWQKNVIDIINFCEHKKIDVRFIEMMPIGKGKEFEPITQQMVIELIEEKFGKLSSYEKKLGNGPAKYLTSKKLKIKLGFISALTHEFCSTCNRVRLTSDGYLKSCLFFEDGVNLKDIINDENLLNKSIEMAIYNKPEKHEFLNYKDMENFETKKMFQIGG